MSPKHKLHTELKSGLTTGTCASAVAKASAYMLINQHSVDHVMVHLPVGEEVVLELTNISLTADGAQCSTIKDAGDDPDITNGAEIRARASFSVGDEISITAGEGIGTVTKPGLAVKIGNPAINPTPLRMIRESLGEVVPKGVGIEICIDIPQGLELSRKTFNPKLGIVGGLSILGTTGIVKPMSEEALKDSLVIKLRQMAAYGKTAAILSPGNYGKAFAKEHYNYNEENTVLTSNFIGFMLEKAVQLKFKKLVLIGHIGKLAKLAGGIFNTHSRVADARNEIIASHYFSFTGDTKGFECIMRANTTEEISVEIQKPEFWQYFALLIKKRAEQYVYDELEIELILFSQQTGKIAETPAALELINFINNDKQEHAH